MFRRDWDQAGLGRAGMHQNGVLCSEPPAHTLPPTGHELTVQPTRLETNRSESYSPATPHSPASFTF